MGIYGMGEFKDIFKALRLHNWEWNFASTGNRSERFGFEISQFTSNGEEFKFTLWCNDAEDFIERLRDISVDFTAEAFVSLHLPSDTEEDSEFDFYSYLYEMGEEIEGMLLDLVDAMPVIPKKITYQIEELPLLEILA